MIAKSLLTLGLLLGAVSAQANERILQNLIGDVQNAYAWTCRGESCYDVWQNEINVLNNLTRYTDNSFDGSYLSLDTGNMAFYAAQRICGTSITGDYRWIVAVTNAENQALPRLKYLQELAGIQYPAFCTKYVR